MQRGSDRVWTVCINKQCLPCREVRCYVPLVSSFKKDGRQPRAHLKGYGEVHFDGEVAYIIGQASVNTMSDDDYFEAIGAELVK